ncbi:MAG: hypothetical protein ACRBCI_03825 [Cellvibrionaceae bacterium]
MQEQIIKSLMILLELAEEGLIKKIKIECENTDGSHFVVEEGE